MPNLMKNIGSILFILAVFAFIAAILYPVFSKARQGSGRSCASNEKALWLGIEQYIQDNDEAMPDISDAHGKNTWREVIYAYVRGKRTYQCFEENRDINRDKTLGPDGLPRSYAANYSGNYGRTEPDQGSGAFAGPGSTPLRTGNYPHPEKLILLCEVDNNDRPEFNIDDVALFGPTRKILWAGHDGTSYYLMADGHVKRINPQETYQTYLTGDVATNMWYRDSKAPLSANGIAVLKNAQAQFPDTANQQTG